MKKGSHKFTAPICTYNGNNLPDLHIHTHRHTPYKAHDKRGEQSDHRSVNMNDAGGGQPHRGSRG